MAGFAGARRVIEMRAYGANSLASFEFQLTGFGADLQFVFVTSGRLMFFTACPTQAPFKRGISCLWLLDHVNDFARLTARIGQFAAILTGIKPRAGGGGHGGRAGD